MSLTNFCLIIISQSVSQSISQSMVPVAKFASKRPTTYLITAS